MRILTFDIEDWFHILDHKATRDEDSWSAFPSRIDKNMDLIFEILHRYNQKATFFCLGWIAEKNPHLIKRIISNGFEIGTHSYSHQIVYEQNQQDFRRDLIKSIAILEDLSGQKIRYYRAPGFSITKDCIWAFEILAESGIEIDCSIFPARRNHGGIPTFNSDGPAIIQIKDTVIRELPVSVRKIAGMNMIFSGGGYFRIFPYWLIRKLVWNSDYLMSYFHPRDFDPGQPRLPDLEPSKYFRTYVGLSGATDKINSLLRDFSFVNITEAANSIDWNSVEIIKF